MTVNHLTHTLWWKGDKLPLTNVEFGVIARMVLNHGHPISYRDLYDLVTKPGFVAGSGPNGYQINMRSMIKRIRRKLEAAGAGGYIINHERFGYSWLQSDTCKSRKIGMARGR